MKKKVTITLTEEELQMLDHMISVRCPRDSKGNYCKFSRTEYLRNRIESDFRNWSKEQDKLCK